jgi:hypothetical protein
MYPPRRQLIFNELYGITRTFQKTEIFITTAVRTSNSTSFSSALQGLFLSLLSVLDLSFPLDFFLGLCCQEMRKLN